MARIKYRIGDEVSHKDNLEHKMRVRGSVFEDNQLRYIVCSWWEGPKLNKDNFHSHELIPWGIAEQGQGQVDDYLKSLETEHLLKNIQKQ